LPNRDLFSFFFHEKPTLEEVLAYKAELFSPEEAFVACLFTKITTSILKVSL
jgi:hypothetical protein